MSSFGGGDHCFFAAYYESKEEAEKDDAVHYVPSSISLYGHSGLCDISEIASVLLNAAGAKLKIMVSTDGLHYYDLDWIIDNL